MNAPPIRRNRYANAGPQPQSEEATAQLSSGTRVDVLAVMQRDATDAARLRSQQDTAYALRRLSESDAARAAVAELVAAAEAMEERIAYYAEMGESAEVNIEDWAYTDNSGDMARLRAALAAFSEAQS